MSDYLECAECGANKFMAEWDRVECENGHGLSGILPPRRDGEVARLKAELEAAKQTIESQDWNTRRNVELEAGFTKIYGINTELHATIGLRNGEIVTLRARLSAMEKALTLIKAEAYGLKSWAKVVDLCGQVAAVEQGGTEAKARGCCPSHRYYIEGSCPKCQPEPKGGAVPMDDDYGCPGCGAEPGVKCHDLCKPEPKGGKTYTLCAECNGECRGHEPKGGTGKEEGDVCECGHIREDHPIPKDSDCCGGCAKFSLRGQGGEKREEGA